MSRTNALIAYFRACLREERSRAGIESVFASKVLSCNFLKGEEDATQDEFTAVVLPEVTKAGLVHRAQLLRRDTEFLYVTMPVTGTWEGRAVCCPLLLYPIRGTGNELFLNLEQVRINPAIFSTFGVSTSAESDFLDLIPNGALNEVSPVLLGKVLKEHLPDLNLSPLKQFPILMASGKVREARRNDRLKMFPASAVVLVERSKNVAGLLQELKILEKVPSSDLSAPLRAFLNAEEVSDSVNEVKGRPEFVPAMLSDSQLSLIDSVNSSAITACQGPPGTGKSFSIAAAAAEQLLRGKSVLICCRTDEAADVLHAKLMAMVPSSGQIIRAGRRKHLRQLRGEVASLLGKIVTPPAEWKHRRLSRQVEEAVKGIYRQERWLTQETEEALEKGEWFQAPPEAWWTKARKWVHLKTFSLSPLLAEVAETCWALHRERYEKAREFHRSLHQKNLAEAMNNPEVCKTLRAYHKALTHRYANDQEEALHRIDPSLLFSVFPIWITTTDDLHRVLPLKPELFDLAIVDEATQCDLPSVLPVLFRAKRALITGDPKQLRHISFLSRERQNQLAQGHGLTFREQEEFHYRRVSAIDRALERTIGTPAYVMLNEHFRSLPDLIRFSNEKFYSGGLHLMREPETLRHDSDILKFSPVQGNRCDQGVNRREIMAAMDLCRKLVREGASCSVGFLSPFRAQVTAFTKAMRDHLTAEEIAILLKRNHLIAGTGHSFQGDERDGMIISLGVTNDCPSGVRRFVEREDIFNVAITRARHWMEVIHSLKIEELPMDSLLRAYLEQGSRFDIDDPTDPSLRDLLPTLEGLGWKQVSRRKLSGVPVDLLLQNGDALLAIDLVGTGGEEGESVSFTKSLILMRSGVPLVPLRIDEWLHRRAEVLVFLKKFAP